MFDRVYPKIPKDIREAVYRHAFAKYSHRVGRSQLDLETKVEYATRAWVLHNQTAFEQDLEDRREELYEETIGKFKKFDYIGDQFGRELAYDEYYAGKAELVEELKNEYFQEVDTITAPWK